MINLFETRAKIICTIGPSSSDYETLVRMIDAGMDIARLNFSHGSHDAHRQVMDNIRKAAAQVGKQVALLQDLQGPKIRVGIFKNGPIELHIGEKFTITSRDVDGDQHIVSTTYKELPGDVKVGDDLLLDDGLLRLRVVSKTGTDVVCEVIIGGVLKNNKGINLPGVHVSAPSLTEKDAEDLLFGLANDVDYVALSFVRKPEDILHVKEVIRAHGKNTPVVAKIEKPEAIDCIERIIAITDGLMVARGDLGVEMKTEEVPPIQKRLIHLCNRAGVPVITATQMLDSMVNNPRPTRAEASDVANAILDGSDAVMLSAETASGKYPVETIATMKQIIKLIEKEIPHDQSKRRKTGVELQMMQEGIAIAACGLADMLEADAIVNITMTGAMSKLVAKHRPGTPIIAITHSEQVCRQLNLVWGVRGINVADLKEDIDESIEKVKKALVKRRILSAGQRILITAGLPFGGRGATNTVRVETV
ncbi:MAG TPA: pyruvate kinase [bacterium]|nr:pyruvate kinase [bacterium]HMW35589.1 pyruvate kinase [bacterium]HMY35498.1 pyruvate kinase [bacterium]HMZ04170.1 pyruvate kinase [bacterium]HNB10061.1 pyruvate kinase [bacterium]